MLTPELGVRVSAGNRLWTQPASATRLGIISVIFSGVDTSNLLAWHDGSPIEVAGTATVAVNTTGNASIGTYTAVPIGPHNFAGDIGDVIVYDRALGDAERQTVESFLQRKYAAALSPPAAVPGMVLWLDAEQLAGLQHGSAIASWPDVSGANHSASQSSSSRRPVFSTNVFNGRPVVRFDGIDDFLAIAGAVVSGSTSRTVFVVARPNVVRNVSYIDLGTGGSTGAAFMLTPEYGVRVHGGNRLYQAAAATNAAQLYTVSLNGPSTTDLTAWVNGVGLGVANTVVSTINTTGTGLVGTYTAVPVGPHNLAGDIAEIIVYNRALSTQERATVEQSLGNKYGIALP
jgi:hypothetical protein